MTTDELRLETLAITAGRPPDTPGNPLSVPIVVASNFRAGGAVEYTRDGGTDTWRALEQAVGVLEGGVAVAFGSGMAAAAAILESLPTGASVVVPVDCYAGVRTLLDDGAAHGRWKVSAVDITDTAATERTAWAADLLWLESPTNPLIDIADLPRLCGFGRDRGATVVVDNTFATPLLQRPLTMGADLVLHSATKFIGGRRQLSGGTPGALESYLALRGLRTMPVRLERAQRSAGELAVRLAAHPAVSRVRYPGLPSDPGHARAAAQMADFGAMLAFEVTGGAAAADSVCAAVRVVVSATSLGGVESTIERRAKLAGQEHIPGGLVRMSVGVEHVEDLWTDLDRALVSARA